jgi:hypothetical protein
MDVVPVLVLLDRLVAGALGGEGVEDRHVPDRTGPEVLPAARAALAVAGLLDGLDDQADGLYRH